MKRPSPHLVAEAARRRGPRRSAIWCCAKYSSTTKQQCTYLPAADIRGIRATGVKDVVYHLGVLERETVKTPMKDRESTKALDDIGGELLGRVGV